MLKGDELWCQLFSETEAGSDLANVSTRAVLDGDEWVVSGQKVWTSSAPRSEWGILLARTDPDAPKHQGITYFLVDMATPGIEVRPLRQMTGDAHFSEVFLDEVRIPTANVVGEVGDGWRIAQTTLASERTAIAGGSGGADPPGLIELAAGARPGPGPASSARPWSTPHLRSELLRFLRYRSQTALSQGKAPGPETSVMKLVYARFMQQMTNAAMQVQGPTAMLAGADVPRGGVWTTKFLHAPSLRIAGGSDQIQGNIIGERVLGLPARTSPIATPRSATWPRRVGRFGAMAMAADALTSSQAARRQRVLVSALELAAAGGYDAVQMRDVATSAGVALGTIYRYFPSKDALLAAAMVEWMEDLERRVGQRGPRGETTAERVYDVLRRAVATMERQPQLAEAVITALTSDDEAAGRASISTTDVMTRVMLQAFPDDVDPAIEAAIAKVLGHVWFSCMVAWKNGVGDMTWMAEELQIAADLICGHLD